MTTRPQLLVLGAGPGVGLSVARRFGDVGHAAALVGASADDMAPLVDQLADEDVPATGHGVDLTDPDDVRRVVTEVAEAAGGLDVLHFNPSFWREADPLGLTVDELVHDVRIGAGALLPAVQAAHPFMVPGGRVLVTGSAAADTPWHGAATLGVQKAAVRNLVTSLDATLEPSGVRAVTVQVNGLLSEEGAFSPPRIAEALFAAAQRSDRDWTAFVPYDG